MNEDKEPDNLTGSEWVEHLIKNPSLADNCVWSKLDGRDWSFLLISQPQLAAFKACGA